MGRWMPELSEEEREKLFLQAIKAHRFNKSHSIYDGNEVRRLAARLYENPERVRNRLRKAGYQLTQSRSGCRAVWKKQSQSPNIYTNQED